MKYPQLEIYYDKIVHNTKEIVKLCNSYNIKVAGVTKAVPEIAEAMIEGGVAQIADSRIENIRKIQELRSDHEIILLRAPMLSRIKETIEVVDISLNSELKIIKALSKEALRQNKVHKIILMIDTGDLREGIWLDRVIPITKEILKLKGIKLEGIGTNLVCFGGVAPSVENMNLLLNCKKKIEKEFNYKINIVSGGNSANLKLLKSGKMPKGINHLRIGEAILLGREALNRDPWPGTYQDTFVLKAEVIEVQNKPSIPQGKIVQDAFGHIRKFEDNGIRKRAILAIGRQDVIPEGLTSLDKNIKILGASSDHLICDVTDCDKEVKVGDILSFYPNYGALLSLITSDYVDKKIIHKSLIEELKPNPNRKLYIIIDGNKYARYPVKTHIITPKDNIEDVVFEYTKDRLQEGDIVAIGEKVIAITQGRRYKEGTVKPSWLAKKLSSKVFKHPNKVDIGLSSPETMQLAIDEVGLLRILLATFVAALTKPFGIKGMFYRVAGRQAAMIDGFYAEELGEHHPCGRYMTKGPKNPKKVVKDIEKKINAKVAIVDVCDIGSATIACSKGLSKKFIAQVLRDNPMGQEFELTPIVIIRKVNS